MKPALPGVVIPENVYRIPLRLLVGADRKKASRQIRECCPGWTQDLPPESFGRCMFSERDRTLVVWIHSARDLPVLLHELTHATFFVLENRGVPTTAEADEAFTYLLQYFLTSALRAVGLKKLSGTR